MFTRRPVLPVCIRKRTCRAHRAGLVICVGRNMDAKSKGSLRVCLVVVVFIASLQSEVGQVTSPSINQTRTINPGGVERRGPGSYVDGPRTVHNCDTVHHHRQLIISADGQAECRKISAWCGRPSPVRIVVLNDALKPGLLKFKVIILYSYHLDIITTGQRATFYNKTEHLVQYINTARDATECHFFD